jgi:hypothetical protein
MYEDHGAEEMKTCLTDFKIYALHVACCLGNVDVSLILQIRGDGEDLGAEFERVALGVLRFGCLAGCLVEGRAAPGQLVAARQESAPYVV